MSNSDYNKGYVFTAACMGMLVFGIVMISLGSILPEITTKFNLNELETGSLPTLLPLGILVGSLVFGPAVDWLSYKGILVAGTILVLVSLEGIVFANKLPLLQISVFGIGLGGGILNGTTNAIVSEISKTNRSANLSLLGVFFGVGALGTPVILGALNGLYSFETIFAWLGIVLIIPLLFFLFLRFPISSKANGIPIKEGLKMLRDPLLVLFGLVLFLQSGIEGITNNWATTYLESNKALISSKALFVLSSFVGAITVTRIVLGKVLRMYEPIKVMGLGFVIALIGCLLILFGSSFSLLITGMIALGIGAAAGFPVILGYVGHLYAHLSGTAFSIVITIALIGNVLANYFMGLVSQYQGTAVLPYFLIVAIVLLFPLLYITNNKYQSKIN
nr:MFS transporter [Allomuricauda sp.]